MLHVYTREGLPTRQSLRCAARQYLELGKGIDEWYRNHSKYFGIVALLGFVAVAVAAVVVAAAVVVVAAAAAVVVVAAEMVV